MIWDKDIQYPSNTLNIYIYPHFKLLTQYHQPFTLGKGIVHVYKHIHCNWIYSETNIKNFFPQTLSDDQNNIADEDVIKSNQDF